MKGDNSPGIKSLETGARQTELKSWLCCLLPVRLWRRGLNLFEVLVSSFVKYR